MKASVKRGRSRKIRGRNAAIVEANLAYFGGDSNR